ncbi:MAG: NINE protein [Candidatus Omnitrophota bacterium]
MKCVNHLDKDAAVVCNHCGKSICSECYVELKGENYCQDCLKVKQGSAKKEERSPVLAAILSFILAGLGQFYNGQVGKGLLVFFTSFLVIPWIIGIIDAYKTAKRINQGEIIVKRRLGCLIAFIVGVAVFWVCIFLIGILAAIAIPNFLKMSITAREHAAEAILKSLSAGIEDYASEHNGNYPSNESELVDSKHQYLFQTYNHRSVNGYTFIEDLRPDGYTIIARPNECNANREKIFTIEKNGVLSSRGCEEE